MTTYTSLKLCSARPEDTHFGEALAEATNLSFRTARDPADALGENASTVLVVDASDPAMRGAFEHAVRESRIEKREPGWRDRVHYVHDTAEKLCRDGILIRGQPASHFICRNAAAFVDARSARQAAQHYSRILWSRMAHSGTGLGALMPETVSLESLKLSESSQRSYAAEAIRHQLVDLRVRDRIADAIANTTDELLMNAMFNAPHDDAGHPLFSRTAGSTHFPLTGRQRVELQFAVDDPYIGITVTDLYGTLRRSTVLDFLSRAHDGRMPLLPSTESENGGTGLASAFRSGASFVFRCEPGVRTEVTVFFRRAVSYQEFTNQFQFISLDYPVSSPAV